MRVLEAKHHEGFRDGHRWTVRVRDGEDVIAVEACGVTREEAEADAIDAVRNRRKPTGEERVAMKRASAAITRGFGEGQ